MAISLAEPRLPDATERERAATTFDLNVVVTAGAGTGKSSGVTLGRSTASRPCCCDSTRSKPVLIRSSKRTTARPSRNISTSNGQCGWIESWGEKEADTKPGRESWEGYLWTFCARSLFRFVPRWSHTSDWLKLARKRRTRF